MSKDFIVMREEEMVESVHTMDKCYNGMDSASRGVPKQFSSLNNSGVFSKGINTIGKQLNNITNSIFNVKNIVNKRTDEMFSMDRKMAQIAQKIEIPQDFVENNTMNTNTFNQVLLEKMDGRSVNEGHALTDIESIADNSIRATALGDITTSTVTKEEVLDSSTNTNDNVGDRTTNILGKQNINNINNSQTLNTQNINENTSVSKQLLKDINNMNDLVNQKIDSSTSVSNVILKNINSNPQTMSQGTDQINFSNSAVNLNDISNLSGLNKIDIDSNISSQFAKISSAVDNLNDDIGGDK